tara:strand:- start:601 stop:801 length:201 start_codon:yes stop_codon:yes gene_type:complete
LTSGEGKKYFMGVSKSKENIDMIEELQNQECQDEDHKQMIEEKLRKMNDIIDCSKYKEDDYIVALA